MKCPKCGNTAIKPGQKFCTKCGERLLEVTDSQLPTTSKPEEKGFIDNITHWDTFRERGSRGVQAEIRREQVARVQREAEQLGMSVTRGNAGSNNNTSDSDLESNAPTRTRTLTVDTESIEGVEIVSGRAIWNIGKGEVARRITEREFANAVGLKGIIIQEGCSALVYIDGQFITAMQEGAYTFPAKTDFEKKLEIREKELAEERDELEKERELLEKQQREEDKKKASTFASRGVFGEIAAFGRGVTEFLFGRKKDESIQSHQNRTKRVNDKLEKIQSPKICRVYLVSNRVLNLVFSTSDSSQDMVDFKPFVVPTRVADVKIGVSLQAQINNINLFVTNYLADESRLSLLGMQRMMEPLVQSVVNRSLRNLDYQQDGLPEPVVANIKERIRLTLNESLQGIEVVKVIDITDSSDAFDRFRAVEQELFATDKELDFLQRTGEYRNRLEQVQNKQEISHASTEEELRKALQSINKDGLLREDEMEEFVLLLNSQKLIREAKTKEQEYEALAELKKSRLVKDDDLAALENTLEQGKVDRENVTEIMRIQAMQKLEMAQQIAAFELSDSRMEHDMAVALRQSRHQGNLASAQLDTKRLLDAYDDERNEFDWNRAFSRRQQEEDYSFNQAQRQREADMRNQMQQEDYEFLKLQREQQLREQAAQSEHERAEQSAQNSHSREMDRLAQLIAARDRAMAEMSRHEESMHQMDVNVAINRDTVESNMSAEQLMAKRAADLDKDAQKAFAEALSSGNKVRAEMLEQQIKEKESSHQEMAALYQQMLRNQQAQGGQNQEFMLKMAEMMQQGMMGAAGAQMAQQQRQFNQQQAFQQQRYDDQVQMKQEYQQQAQYAQHRQEHAQDQAFGAMGKVAGAAASNLGAFNGGFNGSSQQTAAMHQFVNQPANRICPACGAVVADGDLFCECGQKMHN